MRNVMLTFMALAVAVAALMTEIAPAAAYDYPWCAQGRGFGIPGDCSYQTYRQCEASASGRALTCNINPRAVLNQPGRGRRYSYYR